MRCLTMFFLLAGLSLSSASMKEFREFLPAGKLIQQGKTRTGIARLKKMAARNEFASVTLYLIYSRGYCGEKASPQMAITGYFDHLLGTPFHSRERQLYTQKRFPAAEGRNELILRDEYGHYHAKLQGKYPVSKCYEEEMLQIGGVVPRAIYEVVRVKFKEWREPMAAARKMGSAAAYQWQYDVNISKDTPEFRKHVENLKSAAGLGHIPSMIELAEIKIGSVPFPPDFTQAHKLLKTAQNKLKKYSDYGCFHGDEDMKKTEKLLKITAAKNQGGSIQRIMNNLSNSAKSSAAWQELYALAEKGNPEAIRYLIRHQNKNAHGFYLAGKFNAGAPDIASPEACYRKALAVLQEQRRFGKVSRQEYQRELKLLAAVLPYADEIYRREFPVKPEIRIAKVACPDALRTEWVKTPFGRLLKLRVSPCEQSNYVDIELHDNRIPADIRLGASVSFSPDKVWAVAADRTGKTVRFYINNPCQGIIPCRIRINIAPVERNFELTLEGAAF